MTISSGINVSSVSNFVRPFAAIHLIAFSISDNPGLAVYDDVVGVGDHCGRSGEGDGCGVGISGSCVHDVTIGVANHDQSVVPVDKGAIAHDDVVHVLTDHEAGTINNQVSRSMAISLYSTVIAHERVDHDVSCAAIRQRLQVNEMRNQIMKRLGERAMKQIDNNKKNEYSDGIVFF